MVLPLYSTDGRYRDELDGDTIFAADGAFIGFVQNGSVYARTGTYVGELEGDMVLRKHVTRSNQVGRVHTSKTVMPRINRVGSTTVWDDAFDDLEQHGR